MDRSSCYEPLSGWLPESGSERTLGVSLQKVQERRHRRGGRDRGEMKEQSGRKRYGWGQTDPGEGRKKVGRERGERGEKERGEEVKEEEREFPELLAPAAAVSYGMRA